MATALHTFTDIFNTEIEYQGEVIPLKKIVIPTMPRGVRALILPA